jgi:hypothetical protein
MSERLYLLAVDANSPLVDLEKVRHYVTTSNDFSSWWNHLAAVFILETELSAETIGETLHELAPQAKFLLTEVNLANSQGWLPEVSWRWVEERALSPTPEMSVRF